MEITLLLRKEEWQKYFDEACEGRGNELLYNVRKSESDLQCHFLGTPKEWDGISAMALLVPLMCKVVNGDAFVGKGLVL